MYKSVIFDLDGTLLDTIPLSLLAFDLMIEEFTGKQVSHKDILSTFGPAEKHTVSCFLPEKDVQKGVDRYNQLFEELLPKKCSHLFEGVLDILNFLREKQVNVSLVTGRGEPTTKVIFKTYNLDEYFSYIKTGSPIKNQKNLHITEILNAISVQAKDALYIGDAASDVEQSRIAGTDVFSVLWSSMVDKEEIIRVKPNAIFYQVEELYKHLQTLYGA